MRTDETDLAQQPDEAAAPAASPTKARQSRWAAFDSSRLPLLILVFVGGVVSLGLEVSGPRLMAPFFGTTQLIWAVQIGFTLLYLSLGYWIGGRVADRYPNARLLCAITTIAAVAAALIPFISKPILNFSVNAFSSFNNGDGTAAVGYFVATLLGVVLLFAVPVTLLGMVSPFAIRLSVRKVGETGTNAGNLYALSTIGSIIGAFLPTLLLIPAWGVRRTILALAFALLLASLWGLRPRARLTTAAIATLLLLLIAIPALYSATLGPLKPQPGLIDEQETLYNYVQVTRDAQGTNYLILNEGDAIHSIYNPDKILYVDRGWYSDYLLAAPYFNDNFQNSQVHKLAIVGLAGGTIARQYSAAYHLDRIDGAELDPAIVAVARKYFGLHEPNLHVYYGDGRTFIASTKEAYDVVAVDAFQQPYMPFQLTTTEFYTAIHQQLTRQGVVAIKTGHCGPDYRLVNALVNTLYAAGFASVYTEAMPGDDIDINIIATVSPTSIETLRANLAKEAPDSLIGTVAPYMLAAVKTAQAEKNGLVFTDDRAPVEQITDATILTCVQRH
jgi:predicted membrane-bound spermidine synthase